MIYATPSNPAPERTWVSNYRSYQACEITAPTRDLSSYLRLHLCCEEVTPFPHSPT
ncbi:hypothetical protein EXIGLDRAFT_724427 [Exidia glandulosa HHB12029]|uniref:Uncharacterized protein n=1 Tax=Exidia glandulosa HHB12029 TaxID=1314781 RepID=A0A165EF84_EXIGL|nr:hypothetical protein EXIGLDRAFT_724427 [Exidia glandulosa HHB12029]